MLLRRNSHAIYPDIKKQQILGRSLTSPRQKSNACPTGQCRQPWRQLYSGARAFKLRFMESNLNIKYATVFLASLTGSQKAAITNGRADSVPGFLRCGGGPLITWTSNCTGNFFGG